MAQLRRSFLIVTPSYLPCVSGAVTFVEAMARRLASEDHRVTVLTTAARQATDFWQPPSVETLHTTSRLPLRETVDGVTIERLSLSYPRPAPYAFGILRRSSHVLGRTRLPPALQGPLLRWLARWMPPLPGLAEALQRLVPAADIVQAVDSSWDGLFTAGFAAARRHGKPFVAVPLMHLGDQSVRCHFQMAHQIEAYRHSQAVLALSQAEALAYRTLRVASENVHTICMGLDMPPRGTPPAGDIRPEKEFRQHYGLSGPLVAFLGANTYDKGAFTLARAVAQLARGGLSISLVFAGSGSEGLRSFLAKQPMELRQALEGRIHILGLVDEKTKHDLLSACDLLALPSQVDTFGIVLLEAWLHGKPVIGADAGGIPDVVQDGETGLLVPFGDAEALAAAVRRLVESPALAAQLGEAGRRQVLGEYTWDRTYQTLKQVYATVLE